MLDDVLDEPAGLAAQAAPERAHHPGGHARLEPQRIAHRDHELARAVHAQHREIGRRIAA